MSGARALLVGAALACGIAAGDLARAEADLPAEPSGYREEAYQAPTPKTVLGAAALSTPDAEALWAAHRAIFIDVLPHAPRPGNLPAGTIWNDKPHRSIAGAVWLPEVGRGSLSAATEAYFRASLDKLSAGDRSQSLVIFCKRDCWMSWNAVKRARGYGFTGVAWFADGVEGWSEAGLPLAVVEPSP